MSSIPATPPTPVASRTDLAWRLALSEPDRKSIHTVRVHVFHHEQGFSLEDEVDSWDEQAVHFVLYSQQDPTTAIGTLRLVPLPSPGNSQPVPKPSSTTPLGPAQDERTIVERFRSTFAVSTTTTEPKGAKKGAKLGRLAVLPHARKGGTGTFLVRAAETWLANVLRTENEGQECTIKLGAQLPVMPFYRKLGYEAVGEPFDDAGAPHMMMVKSFVL